MMKIISDINLPKRKKEKKERKLTKEEKEKIKKRKEFFEGKRGQKRKFVIVFSTLLIALLFFGLLRMVSSEKEFKKNFFATKCEGEWQNPANAEGMPEVLAEGTINSFSERNSAVYRGGAQNLECRWFNEVKKEGELEKKDPCGEDYELCNLSSAKIYFSFAIDNNEDGDFSIEENNSPEEKNFQTEESSADFQLSPQEETSQPKLTSGPEISEEPANPSEEIDLDTRLIIYYSLDNGKTWNFLKKINELPLSNYLNGGYFSFDAPFIKSWYDIENLKIKVEGVVGGEEKIISFVDAMWVDTVSRKKFKASEEISEKIFSMFEDEKKPEKLEIIQKEFEYKIPTDGKIIVAVNSEDEKIDGVFRIGIFSKNELVSMLDVISGEFSEFEGDTIEDPYKKDKIKRIFFLEQGEKKNTASINVKKEWGKVQIKIDYIPLEVKEQVRELTLDNLEILFSPYVISFETSNFLDEVVFKFDEKGEKEIFFTNEEEGNILIETTEEGKEEEGLYLIYLDNKGVAIIETGYPESQLEFLFNVPIGNHKLVIKHISTKWISEGGKKTIKVFFQKKEGQEL